MLIANEANCSMLRVSPSNLFSIQKSKLLILLFVRLLHVNQSSIINEQFVMSHRSIVCVRSCGLTSVYVTGTLQYIRFFIKSFIKNIYK